MAAATQHVVVLMPPEDKARLEEKARRAGTSIGEIVRRFIDTYDPELQALSWRLWFAYLRRATRER